MNNLSSHCGLVDAKIRASDKDLPVHTVKSKGKISQNFVAFSEYMNFNLKVVKSQKSKGTLIFVSCPHFFCLQTYKFADIDLVQFVDMERKPKCLSNYFATFNLNLNLFLFYYTTYKSVLANLKKIFYVLPKSFLYRISDQKITLLSGFF